MSMSNRLVPRSLKQPRPRRGTSRVRHARLPAGSPSGEPRRHLPAGFPFVSQNRTDDLAIASMVPGIVWAYWVGSALSLVFGHMAKRRCFQRSRERPWDGRSPASSSAGPGSDSLH